MARISRPCDGGAPRGELGSVQPASALQSWGGLSPRAPARPGDPSLPIPVHSGHRQSMPRRVVRPWDVEGDFPPWPGAAPRLELEHQVAPVTSGEGPLTRAPSPEASPRAPRCYVHHSALRRWAWGCPLSPASAGCVPSTSTPSTHAPLSGVDCVFHARDSPPGCAPGLSGGESLRGGTRRAHRASDLGPVSWVFRLALRVDGERAFCQRASLGDPRSAKQSPSIFQSRPSTMRRAHDERSEVRRIGVEVVGRAQRAPSVV